MMDFSPISGRLYTLCLRLSTWVIVMKAKANDSSSQTGDRNTSSRKISPSNCFVPGKNSPAYRINTHLRTYKAILTCPKIEQGTGSSPEPQCIYGLLEGPNYKFKIKTNQKRLKMDGITKSIYLACFY